MRFELSISPKMKAKKSSESSSDVAQLEQKLNDISLECGPKNKNDFQPNDLDVCKNDSDEKVVVVKKEEDDQVDEAADALNDLSIQVKTEEDVEEEEDERIERGPVKSLSYIRDARDTAIPYVNKQLTAGCTVKVNDYQQSTQQLSAGGSVEIIDGFSQELYEMYHFLTSDQCAPIVIQSVQQTLGVGEVEVEPVLPKYTMPDTPPPSSSSSYTRTTSPAILSPISSGYESGTSSPSHSPPRGEEPLLPEPIQQINNRKQSYRPILPRVELNASLAFQNKFYKYIQSFGKEDAANIFDKTHRMYFLNDLKNLTKPLKDGDTMLMIFIANPSSARQIAENLNYNSLQEKLFRLCSIFHLVERFHRECPQALEAKNSLNQSVLHLAASNCYDHPLVAPYVAEKLQLHGYDFKQYCTAMHCKMIGGGNLLHCIAQNGDTHAEVLNNLLQVEKLRELKDSPCHLSDYLVHTPLHVAIKAQNSDETNTIKSVKTVKYLIDHNVILTKKVCNFMMNSALHNALQGRPSYELVELILNHSRDEVNVLGLNDMHPLMILAKASSQLKEEETLRILKLLLNKGATLKKVPASQHAELFNEFSKNLSLPTSLDVEVMLRP
ncbi:uncharacterized protein LOC132201688 [Neocloeon triangulifer]|uniref:uncharacterized protein LOC132201688 n=1 Tax=Neocloeon triangulifer TaxID=2078957 RepID=UPI00286F8094|nr:uncharacterized protein LOC132201688 [Neocloeon triangulifer]